MIYKLGNQLSEPQDAFFKLIDYLKEYIETIISFLS